MLHTTFYDGYNYDKAVRRAASTETTATTPPARKRARKGKGKARSRRTPVAKGKTRGIKLERALERFIKRERTWSQLQRHPQSVWTSLLARNIVLVDAQVPIWSAALQFATAIDFLGVDILTGSLWVIELKSGFQFHDASSGFMKPPLQTLGDCPRNQHYLQLQAMVHTLQSEYNCPTTKGLLVRVTPEDTVEMQSPHASFLTHLWPKAVSALRNARPNALRKRFRATTTTTTTAAAAAKRSTRAPTRRGASTSIVRMAATKRKR